MLSSLLVFPLFGVSAVFVFVLNAGSPSYINSTWLLNSRLNQGGSRRNSETEAMDATPHISLVFHPPELPEDTLMEVQTNTMMMILWSEPRLIQIPHEQFLYSQYLFFSQQAHTDALSDLRFTLAFVHCVMELASTKDPGLDAVSSPDVSFLEQSLVTDQISLLSREWRWEAFFLHFLNMYIIAPFLHKSVWKWLFLMCMIPAMQSS